MAMAFGPRTVAAAALVALVAIGVLRLDQGAGRSHPP